MTNTNCLEGLRCPDCGNEERLLIHGKVRLDVTDDGCDVADGSDWHWDDTSLAICPACDRDGPLGEFRVPTPGDGQPPDRFTRGYSHLSRAWYAETCQMSGVADEIMVGLYHRGGGCRWEFAVRWHRLPALTPRVEVFRDAWVAFAEVPEVFAALAECNALTPDECREMLERAGFKDRTQTERTP